METTERLTTDYKKGAQTAISRQELNLMQQMFMPVKKRKYVWAGVEVVVEGVGVTGCVRALSELVFQNTPA